MSDKLENNNEIKEMKEKLTVKGIRKHPVLLIIIGMIGIILTGTALVIISKKSKDISGLFAPIVYGFIPFVLSFVLIKMGIKELLIKQE